MGDLPSGQRDVWHQRDAGSGSVALYRDRSGAGCTSYVLGIINLRGNVVTVIDTRQRFGLEPAPVSDNTRIVIIEADRRSGIMVDSVAEVVYLRQSEIETAPNVGNDESAKFIQGVCNKNGELLILVELDKMMSEEEWAELESI